LQTRIKSTSASIGKKIAVEILENPQFHLEYFSNVQRLGERLGKRLCEDLVIFENPFRIFIDQIFGGSKSDWIF
jgi:hypothetical protein